MYRLVNPRLFAGAFFAGGKALIAIRLFQPFIDEDFSRALLIIKTDMDTPMTSRCRGPAPQLHRGHCFIRLGRGRWTRILQLLTGRHTVLGSRNGPSIHPGHLAGPLFDVRIADFSDATAMNLDPARLFCVHGTTSHPVTPARPFDPGNFGPAGEGWSNSSNPPWPHFTKTGREENRPAAGCDRFPGGK